MSILDFSEDEKIAVGTNFAQAPSFTRADAFSASLSETTATSLTNSQGLFENNLLNERSKKYKELTGGNDLYGDAVSKYVEDKSNIYSTGKSGQKLRTENPKVLEALDKHITQLKLDEPDKYSELLTQKELKQRSDQERLNTVMGARRVQAGAPKDFLTMGANLAGGVIASFQDPVNLLTSTFGAGASAGLLKTIAIEAGINMATEALTVPDRVENYETIGLEYGTNEIIKDLITAGAFGAVFAGGLKGVLNVAEHISLKRANAVKNLENEIKSRPENNTSLLEDEAPQAEGRGKQSALDEQESGGVPILNEKSNAVTNSEIEVRDNIVSTLSKKGLRLSKSKASGEVIFNEVKRIALESGESVRGFFSKNDLEIKVSNKTNEVSVKYTQKNLSTVNKKNVELQTKALELQEYLDNNSFKKAKSGKGFKVLDKSTGKRKKALDGKNTEKRSPKKIQDEINSIVNQAESNAPKDGVKLVTFKTTRPELRKSNLSQTKDKSQALTVVKVLERELHKKGFDLIDTRTLRTLDGHKLSLKEVNDAYNSGRPINGDNIKVNEKQIMDIDPDKIEDPILRENVREFQEDVRLSERSSLNLKANNPESPKIVQISEDLEPITLDESRIKNQQKLEESINSQAVIDSEVEAFNNIDDSNVLKMEFGDRNSPQSYSKQEISDEIKSNKAIKEALSSCGVG